MPTKTDKGPLADQVKPPDALGYLNLLIYGFPGCLAGDTVVRMNRAGAGKPYKLNELVAMFNGGSHSNGKKWDRSIPTNLQGRDEDGYIRLNEVTNALYSGIKLTYQLLTETDDRLRATKDHRFLTPDGWFTLSELNGREIAVRSVVKAPYKLKAIYKEEAAPYHPLRRTKNRVPEHRLIFEADMNKIEYEEYLYRLHTGEIGKLHFLPVSAVIHHKDENTENNDISNLERFDSNAAHCEYHGKKDGYQHFGYATEFVKITSIRRFEEEETFDLTMKGPSNFVANGIIVHNSGKTWLGGTAQDSPLTSPMLILDVEGGTTTLRHKPGIDVVQVRDLRHIKEIHDSLRVDNNGYYKTVMIDSLTELCKLDMREIMLEASGKNPNQDIDVPSQREWGKSNEHIRRIVRAFRDLEMNTIITALMVDAKDDRTGQVTFFPSVPGKLKAEVPGFLDIVGYLHTSIEGEEITRVIQFQQTQKIIAKDRTSSLGPRMVNPTVPDMWALIHPNGGNNK